jgi:SAM-dependent methyltransferase
VDLQAADLRLPFDEHTFDAVALLAVIEHFPHTPRLVLNEIRRILRPDGVLILDTPNAGSFGTRVGFLLHGEGLWADVQDFYSSDVPFRGHSRCYSRREIAAILGWAGFEIAEFRLFDLGPYRSSSLPGRFLYGGVYRLLLARIPDLRGYVWVASRPKAGETTEPSGVSGAGSS